MSEHPINFSGPEVLATLAGHKTQTREVVRFKPKDGMCATDCAGALPEMAWADPGLGDGGYLKVPCKDGAAQRVYPRWRVSGRLWVRETWRPRDVSPTGLVIYKATGEMIEHEIPVGAHSTWTQGWHPSIHMPRWASRITLEVTDIRAERLQEISDDDCEAEGVKGMRLGTFPLLDKRGPLVMHAFAHVWDSINAKRGHSWESNPWVWVRSFRRLP